jgi:hypothetical protein
MSYRTYQTRPGQSSYSCQSSQASQSSQPRQYCQTQSCGQYSRSQSYATRRPAISSQSRVYHNTDSDDSSSGSEYESDSEDERPRQGSHGYYQATQSSMVSFFDDILDVFGSKFLGFVMWRLLPRIRLGRSFVPWTFSDQYTLTC